MQIETTPIQFPHGFEKAYNCGICDFNGERFIAARVGMHDKAKVYLGRLTRDCVVTDFKELVIGQDPRLFVFQNKLHCSFISVEGRNEVERQALGVLDSDYNMINVNVFTYGGRHEKNWMFFESGDVLRAVYTLHPHTVLTFEDEIRSTVTEYACPWTLGDLHGGTPPVLVDGLLYSFIHSFMDKRLFGWGRLWRVYYTGAYAFEPKYPFRVRYMTPAPFLFGDAVEPIQFLCGAILCSGDWHLTYGANDERAVFCRINHHDLMHAMEQVDIPNPSVRVRDWLY